MTRVFPLTGFGQHVASILAALLRGEPWSIQRLPATALVDSSTVLAR